MNALAHNVSKYEIEDCIRSGIYSIESYLYTDYHKHQFEILLYRGTHIVTISIHDTDLIDWDPQVWEHWFPNDRIMQYVSNGEDFTIDNYQEI